MELKPSKQSKQITAYLFLLLIFFIQYPGFAQTSVSQMQRAQDMLEKERALSQKLEEPQKIYIKKIMVEGALLLSADEVKRIVSAFEKRWLTKLDIERILEALKQSYKDKGYTGEPLKISYQIKQKSLIIRVEELTH